MRLQSDEEGSSRFERCVRRLEVLRPYIKKGSVGAELGVFKGNFIDHLLSLGPSKLYAVDPWYRESATWSWAHANPSCLDALIKILVVFKNDIESGQLIPIVDYSQNFLRECRDDELDWVYIDSTHRYEQTRIELELSCKKVKPGGFILGDDYTPDVTHIHHGVFKAVNEFVADARLKFICEGTYSQFVTQRT